MINVLFITHETTKVLGSTLSLYNMIHSIKDKVNPIVAFPNTGAAYDFVRSKGIKCVVVPFRLNIASKKNKLIKYIPRYIYDNYTNHIAINKLSRIVDKYDIKIVHSNTSVITIGYLLAKKKQIKHVWHLREFQNLDFRFEPFCGWNTLKRMISDSDYSISITHAIANHFNVKNLSNSIVLYDAVRSINDSSLIYPKDNFFLFCGSICESKGPKLALEIFRLLSLKYPNYKLLYVGSGTESYLKELQENINNFNLANRVEFCGYQKDVKSYMEHAATFLMCSRNEAQGRVTVESMFYGCPVIGLNSGGTKEIIKDGVNGFLFNNVQEAVEKVSLVVDNENILKEITSHALVYAQENFTEEKYGEKLIDIYNSMIG